MRFKVRMWPRYQWQRGKWAALDHLDSFVLRFRSIGPSDLANEPQTHACELTRDVLCSRYRAVLLHNMNGLGSGNNYTRLQLPGKSLRTRRGACRGTGSCMTNMAHQILRSLSARPLVATHTLRFVHARARSAQPIAGSPAAAEAPASGKGLRRLARLAEKAAAEGDCRRSTIAQPTITHCKSCTSRASCTTPKRHRQQNGAQSRKVSCRSC